MVLVWVCSLCGRCVVWAPPGPLPPAPLPLALYALAGGGLYHLFVMVLRCWSVRSPSPLAARGVGAKPPLRGYRLGFPGSVDIGLYFFGYALHIISGGRLGPWHCSPSPIAALLAGENARICGHRRGCFDWVDIGLYLLVILTGLAYHDRRAEKRRRAARLIVPSLPVFLPVARFLGLFGWFVWVGCFLWFRFDLCGWALPLVWGSLAAPGMRLPRWAMHKKSPLRGSSRPYHIKRGERSPRG